MRASSNNDDSKGVFTFHYRVLCVCAHFISLHFNCVIFVLRFQSAPWTRASHIPNTIMQAQIWVGIFIVLWCSSHCSIFFFSLSLSLLICHHSLCVSLATNFFFPLHYYLLLLKQNVISILFILCFCFDWINMMIWIGIILFVCVCARVQMSNESTSSIILYFSCRILRFFLQMSFMR